MNLWDSSGAGSVLWRDLVSYWIVEAGSGSDLIGLLAEEFHEQDIAISLAIDAAELRVEQEPDLGLRGTGRGERFAIEDGLCEIGGGDDTGLRGSSVGWEGGDAIDSRDEMTAGVLDSGDAEGTAVATLRGGPEEVTDADFIGPEAKEVESFGRDSVGKRDEEVDGR